MFGSLLYGDGLRPRIHGAQTHVLPGPHGPLRVLSTGDPDGVHVVLIHGTPGSGAGWSGTLSDPPTGMYISAVDRPGFGRSRPRVALPSLRDQAEAIEPVIARSPGPVILVGHSLGAPIACMAAAIWRDRVGGLLLVSGAMDPALERLRWYNWLCRGAGPLAGRALRNSNLELWHLRAELEELRAELPGIRCHASILHGIRDRLTPIGNAAYAAGQLRGAASLFRRDLPGIGHFLPWQRRADMHDQLIRLAVRCASGHRRTAMQASRGLGPRVQPITWSGGSILPQAHREN